MKEEIFSPTPGFEPWSTVLPMSYADPNVLYKMFKNFEVDLLKYRMVINTIITEKVTQQKKSVLAELGECRR